jgi:tripartite ATP-independent transporter DctM subunit
MDAFILLGSFAVLMLVGMPVAYAMGLSALIGALWIDIPIDAVMIQIASGVNKFSLLAIPFFVLAGAIMAEGGMSRRLVAFAGVLVGFIRGGLSLVNILASTFFGAISGSSMADTASIGSVLIPEMAKKGYPRAFATAVTVSGSVQAILIPPSHNAIIYSLAAGGSISIAALFVAGVLPGLLLGLTLAALCMIIAKKKNFPRGERIPLRQALKICVDALWGLMTMVIILGGILTGVFTATESAAIAVMWAFFVTMFIYRDYRWRDLPKLMHRTVKTLTIVMILIGFAASFGYIMTLTRYRLPLGRGARSGSATAATCCGATSRTTASCAGTTPGASRVFRQPSHNANGLARDRQGRLLACEHLGAPRHAHRVRRQHHRAGRPLRRQAAELAQRHRLRVATARCGSPTRCFGIPATGRASPRRRRRRMPSTASTRPRRTLQRVIDDLAAPNGLAFSPDERVLYVVESRATPQPQDLGLRRGADGALRGKRLHIDAAVPVRSTAWRWTRWATSGAALAATARPARPAGPRRRACLRPDGRAIGHIHLPERCANLCFGGATRSTATACSWPPAIRCTRCTSTSSRANGAAAQARTKLSSVSGANSAKRVAYSPGWKAVHTAYTSGSTHSSASTQAARVSSQPGSL